jgi:hypothetical protein
MKINVNNIASLLIDLGIPPEKQGEYLNAATARVLGYLLPLPTTPLSDETQGTRAYFKEHLSHQVVSALDAIIERVPVDVDTVEELACQIWDLRYNLLYSRFNKPIWDLLDTCVNQARIVSAISFNDPALHRLSAVLVEGVEQ